MDFAALRSVLGGLCLLPVIAWQHGPLRPLHIKSMLWLALLQTAGFVGCIALALAGGAVGKSTVLAYTMPLWAVLFAALLLGEHIYGLQWLALGLAGLGLVGIISPWEANFTLASTLFALAAGLWWGISVVIAKRLKLNNMSELLNVSAWQMLIGGVLLGALACFVPGKPTTWNTPFLWALAYNTILASALAWLLWLYALQKLSAGVSSLSSLAVPVVSIALAWLILDEMPTPSEAAGMLLILASLAVISLAAWRRRT
jgi:drug/metabolite transporter (DMT)-like permease